MKVIILAAGQGTRLRPLTDEMPKCMVQIHGVSIIERILDTVTACGVAEQDISIVTGYRTDVLEAFLKERKVNFIYNEAYESTNMVCSLMCARKLMEDEEEIIISYGDIVYEPEVFRKIAGAASDCSVVVDDGWYDYWKSRCENPLEDAETLKRDKDGFLLEIGQKTTQISDIESQYIGLIHLKRDGIRKVLNLCDEAKRRSECGEKLWRTERNYAKMYMTDLLQGLIDEGEKIEAVAIQRGWYEVDCPEDLELAARNLQNLQ